MIGMTLISLMPILRLVGILWTGRLLRNRKPQWVYWSLSNIHIPYLVGVWPLERISHLSRRRRIMETKKRICLILAALLSLSGVLPAAADASDWLPLAVGNSWTYSHDYSDAENGQAKSQWTNFMDLRSTGTPRFTLSVLRTEVIDGHTYFVISDMPEYWPPVPAQFIAGKKLRWAGDHLMERTADGEQTLFRFDGASGTSGEASYDVTTPEGTIQVTSREIRANSTHSYAFIFSGGAGPARVYDPYDDIDYGDLDATGELSRPRPELEARVTFLKGFGVQTCGVEIYDYDAPLFFNVQKARHAEINGRTVTVREAREEAAARLKASDETSIEGNSWGEIKQEESK